MLSGGWVQAGPIKGGERLQVRDDRRHAFMTVLVLEELEIYKGRPCAVGLCHHSIILPSCSGLILKNYVNPKCESRGFGQFPFGAGGFPGQGHSGKIPILKQSPSSQTVLPGKQLDHS